MTLTPKWIKPYLFMERKYLMKLSAHFDLREFNCPVGGEPPIHFIPDLIVLCEQLEVIRSELKAPIHVISGWRSSAYNFQIGGATKSQHMLATAADIKVVGHTSHEVHKTILQLISQGKIHNGGVGLYPTFVHYDIRPKPSRWKGGGL
jgi:uncharacterized protein YcbK (DUF882 family)